MRNWVPVSTSAKGRLVIAALDLFGRHPFDSVAVTELATAAQVTTGALYHHFGSKLLLYDFVRQDVEQRVLDRIAGAVGAGSPGTSTTVTAALLVSFDFAVDQGFPSLLGAPPAAGATDRLADALSSAAAGGGVIGRLLAASWRAALLAVADGADRDEVRTALAALSVNT